jgi:hypothetical protein
MVKGLRYKLWMFCVPINGPARVLYDNEGVVKNSSVPELALNKKANAINYNKVQEAVAKEIIMTGKEGWAMNLRRYFDEGDFWRQAQMVAQPHSVVIAPPVQGYEASMQARPVDSKYSGDGSWDHLGSGASKQARLGDVKLGIRGWWYIGLLFVNGLRCLVAIIVRGD